MLARNRFVRFELIAKSLNFGSFAYPWSKSLVFRNQLTVCATDGLFTEGWKAYGIFCGLL